MILTMTQGRAARRYANYTREAMARAWRDDLNLRGQDGSGFAHPHLQAAYEALGLALREPASFQYDLDASWE